MSKRVIIFLFTIIFLLGVSFGTIGATVANEEIKAILNHELILKVNGRNYVPVDENGSTLTPITYNGRTYLPVRALANALSVAVNYYAPTKTVYLGEREVIPLIGDNYEKYYSSQFTTDQNQLFVNEEQYDSGIVYTGTDGYYEYSGFIHIGENESYQKFGGVVCLEDPSNAIEEITVKIRENDYQGNVLKEITVKNNESISFEIDIPGISTLHIQNLTTDRTPKHSNPNTLIIADPYFK